MNTPWTTIEDEKRIAIVHDNRWLAIIGVPLTMAGLVVAVVPWLIEQARNSGAWPILAVGSLVGAGIIVAGLSLCFNYVEIVGDRQSGLVTRRAGLRPFQRSRSWPVTAFSEIVCVVEMIGRASGPGSTRHHRVRLVGPGASLLLASSLEAVPIRAEAQRWANFLGIPLKHNMETKLPGAPPTAR